MLRSLLAVALYLTTVNALFADQAGEFDWKFENIGRVQFVAFEDSVSREPNSVVPKNTSRALYVASDERSRALARLDSITGEIQWRRVFVKGDAINAIQLTSDGLLSVSGAGRHVRLWDLLTGVLLWDDVTTIGPAPLNAFFGGLIAINKSLSVVLTSSSVAMIRFKDGNVIKQVLPEDFTAAVVAANTLSYQAKSDNTALYLMAGSRHVLEYELPSLKLINRSTLPNNEKTQKPTSVVLRRDTEIGQAVAITLTTDELQLQSLENAEVLSIIALHSLPLNYDKVVAIDNNIVHTLVLLLFSGKRAILKITSNLTVKVAAIVTATTGVLTESMIEDSVLFHAAVKDTGKAIQITSYSLDQSPASISYETQFDMTVYGGKIAHAFVNCPTTTRDSTLMCQALLVLKDDALVMTSNDVMNQPSGQIHWLREEALANIKSVRWITPAEMAIEKHALKRIPSFIQELALEYKRLEEIVERMSTMSWTLFHESSRQRGVDRSRAARKEPRHAHLFGFSKYIVVLTDSGKLFALRAEASTIAWSVFVGPEVQLFVTRDHPALGTGAELLLVSNTTKKLVWLNGDDGHQVEATEANTSSEASWVVLLPKRKHLTTDKEPTARRTVAVIGAESLKIALYPKETAALAHLQVKNFYFYRYDASLNALRGYYLKHDGLEPLGNYRACESWSIVLPREQQVIATSRHHDHSVVDSAVTITGDDSLLIKYLNPNLFAIATLTTQVSLHDKDATTVLYVYLIDAVAGRILHRVRHLDVDSPVRMVQSENWLVYSYWNVLTKRTEMVSLALFDGAIGMHSLNPWKRPSWTPSRSSFDATAPFVLQKSFIYPTKITSLDVTVTAHGITPPTLLVGMETGQIYKLARNFIDPRQPEKPLTPEEQAEGLLLYSPLLPVYSHPQAMLTYNETIENLKAMSTTPTELESTTLVFAYGLDMFYVRMTPAKSFDLLPSDFNHEMLLLLCFTFLVVTFGTKTLAQRKALQTAWK
ncbi:hypothetical protein CCR75_003513 [Bremia lactucae]|uniref:ER membrane protein complex subunit 1 n=1 Tax=Bremia lactucae TaxID=4779 RepID=A0A976IGI9_BRELC|nr:hypothetical protein CCR75_003513 [Bremia lactucae]